MSRSFGPHPSGSAQIAYQPALDGLRAVAVTMVLMFHGKVGWMAGGYFGVSIFFTLSGFLITSLLVREYDANDRIDPKAFYARRVRRLLPASLVCLSGVTLLGAAGVWTGVANLRRDVLGALFQVANWVQLFAGESYTDLQSKNSGLASPLDHYWSLAIEEQFYWIWPLVFWGLARMARRRGWSLLLLMGGLTVFFAAAAPAIAAVWGRDAAYWATPARMAEILIGATLAIAVSTGGLRPRRWMAPVGAATVVGLAVVLPAAGGPAYHGAFALLAVPTAVLLLGVQRPGLVTSALSTRPLVALGRVSYGVYLYHFPILVLMTPTRVGRSGTPLLVLQLGATIAVAALSSRLIERPIRFGRLSGVRTAIWSGVATAGVLGLAFAIPARGAAVYYAPDAELAAAAGIQPTGDLTPLVVVATTPAVSSLPSPLPVFPAATSPPATSPPTAPALTNPAPAPAVTNPALSRPARILVVGDSTALATGAGLVAWAAAHPALAQVSLAVSPGCGFVRGGVVPSDGGTPFQSDCDQLLDHTLPKDLVDLQPDVVMMMVTSRDIVPRRWNDEEGLIDPSDPRFVARIRVDYQVITDLILSTTSARIVWIRAPKVDPYWLGKPHPFIDPGLLQIREGVLVDIVGSNAARSQLLDLRSWMEADGIAGDIAARPDGWHFTPDAALLVAEEWLGPQLLVAASANAVLQNAVTSTTSPTTTATTTGGGG